MAFFASWNRPTETYHTKSYDRIANHHRFNGQGKTILVTGGSSGVGFNISKAFASTGVARIAIISRSVETQHQAKAELEALYPSVEILPYQASISDSTRLGEIVRELGSIDVLVLCASIVHTRAAALRVSTQDVQDAFDINAVAAFDLVKAYLDASIKCVSRKIVLNVSSAAAQVQGTLRVGYGSSKAAAVQIMQHFAVEEEQRVKGEAPSSPILPAKIISFHPGSFYTPSVAAHYTKDHFQWDDINLPAHFALWLAGDESGFLHGRYVWAHWDVDELIAITKKVEDDRKYLTVGLIM